MCLLKQKKYLIEELNHIFNQKGFWHLTDEGNYYLAVIEHDNGSKKEIHDESVDGNDKINLVVVYPNNRSKWIGEFYQEEITDIADKMYEYAVVKNPTKQEGVKPIIRRKRVNESESQEKKSVIGLLENFFERASKQ